MTDEISNSAKSKVVRFQDLPQIDGDVAFFPGRFDPPHIGHAYNVLCLPPRIQKVLIVPREKSSVRPTRPLEERLAMLDLAFDYDPRVIIVDSRDYSKSSTVSNVPPNRILSWERMDYQEKLGPGSSVSVMIGSDHLLEPNLDFYSSIPLIVCLRQAAFAEELKKDHSSLDIQAVLPGLEGISSTAVRLAIKKGESFGFMVHPKVEAYLKEKGTYLLD